MAVIDPVEWFQMHSPARVWGDAFTHGIFEDKTTGEWVVVRKEVSDAMTKVSEIARAPTREGAIGFLKLLKE
jgi:hypothetical protein